MAKEDTMSSGDEIRRGLEQVKRGVSQAIEEARQQAAKNPGSRVNVARRHNVKIVSNVGNPGSVQVASAHQDAPIVQDGETRNS